MQANGIAQGPDLSLTQLSQPKGTHSVYVGKYPVRALREKMTQNESTSCWRELQRLIQAPWRPEDAQRRISTWA